MQNPGLGQPRKKLQEAGRPKRGGVASEREREWSREVTAGVKAAGRQESNLAL